MGCGSSKSVAVVDAMPGCSPSEETKHKEPISVKVKGPGGKKMAVANIITVKEVASCESIPTESQYGSSDSITAMSAKSASSSSNELRNGSAKSTDSGLGKECSVIITENSSPPLKDVATVPENLPEPDLTIDGKQIETPGPIGHRKRTRSKGRLPPVHPTGRKWIQENSNSSASNTADKSLEAILQRRVQFADVLINELPLSSSIVKRPVSRGGVAFDIKDSEGTAAAKSHNRKPACVLKYAEHRRAVKMATHVELDEKQKAADKRRKVSENECTSKFLKKCDINLTTQRELQLEPAKTNKH